MTKFHAVQSTNHKSHSSMHMLRHPYWGSDHEGLLSTSVQFSSDKTHMCTIDGTASN